MMTHCLRTMMILQTMKMATARKQKATRGDLHPKKRWFVADQSAVWVIYALYQKGCEG